MFIGIVSYVGVLGVVLVVLIGVVILYDGLVVVDLN